MFQVLIKRPHSYYGVVRTAKIYIDNIEVGTLKDKEEKIINVTPGEHTIRIGYGVFSGMSNTLKFNAVDNNLKIVFKAKLALYYLLFFISIICGIMLYLGFINSNLVLLISAIILIIPIQIIQTKKIISIDYE